MTMLHVILNIWLNQRVRNIKWRSAALKLYIYSVVLFLGWLTYRLSGQNLSSLLGRNDFSEVIIPIELLLLLPDFLIKLLWKNDATVMDDYLKTRPIPERDWDKFLILKNFISFWNLYLLVLLIPICFAFMFLGKFFFVVLLFYTGSLVNGITVTCIRKAHRWKYIFPVLVGWLIWFCCCVIIGVNVFSLSWILHVNVLCFINLIVIGILYLYIGRFRRYNENINHVRRVRSMGDISLFSSEYISVIRSKRLLYPMIFLPAVFIMQVYSQLLGHGLSWLTFINIIFAICSFSITLGQNIFSIEGNYFDGLWTRPVQIATLLRNKYYFYSILSSIPALLMIPAFLFSDFSLWLLASTLIFIIGVVHPLFIPTCLMSSRVDMFESPFFNYQGSNALINVYGFVIFIPVALYMLCILYLPLNTALIIFCVLGIIGIAFHRLIIARVALIWESKRYEKMEKYRR